MCEIINFPEQKARKEAHEVRVMLYGMDYPLTGNWFKDWTPKDQILYEVEAIIYEKMKQHQDKDQLYATGIIKELHDEFKKVKDYWNGK